jgi:hypothetical protein
MSERSKSGADFQSAVTAISNPQGAQTILDAANTGHNGEGNSAIQQIGNLHYEQTGPSVAFSDILILSDGTLLIHNMTPAMAAIVSELNPQDQAMQSRLPSRCA